MNDSSKPSKLPIDPNDPNNPNNDIWELATLVRGLQERIKEYEDACQRKFKDQMLDLDELKRRCDYMLFQVSQTYYNRTSKTKPPED